MSGVVLPGIDSITVDGVTYEVAAQHRSSVRERLAMLHLISIVVSQIDESTQAQRLRVYWLALCHALNPNTPTCIYRPFVLTESSLTKGQP